MLEPEELDEASKRLLHSVFLPRQLNGVVTRIHSQRRVRRTVIRSPPNPGATNKDGIYLEVPEPREAEFLALLQEQLEVNFEADTSLLQQELLAQVPPQSPHANEVGHMLSAEPVHITLNPAKPLPCVPQYPISKEAEEGIRPVITSLLKQGIIILTRSTCNTPILPIKKPGRDTYRFVQDLRAVNAAVLPTSPVVPNPATILSCIPATDTHFTVIDLCSAFFSIPIHPDTVQRHLFKSRINAILQVPKPTTLKQMRGVLGMAGYCRQWIMSYASIVKLLQALTLNSTPEPLPWLPEAEQDFIQTNQALARAPTLGLPDYKKPFTLYCDERDGIALGVLTQLHSDRQRPIAYYSSVLNPVAAGLPPCLRSIAAAALLVEKADSLVLEHPLTVAVPHAVMALLLKGKTQHISNSRLTKYEKLLLSAASVILTRCSILNPASLLPTPSDGEPHDCLTVTTQLLTPRIDLKDTPLQNPDLLLYVDGSCLRNSKGQLTAGYAVCDQHQV
ncbi:uncharacterized protein LOC112547983 [Alligator sinensis]|uniref:Uncharacterized protein LOC112547983 n=1 Tax=Alligator sinensis TaxID=38654 RepID=A0A3Q0FPB6_ALLSI|nr:uncharacterized protein LOC112547983 [Alligator sinensis]